jgi:glycosyltransferase involved in cell wall biosynthesis
MTVNVLMPKKAHGGISPQKLKVLYIQPGTTSFAGIERVIDVVCTELAERHQSEFDVSVLYTSIHKNYPVEARKYNAIRRVAKSRRMLISTYRDVISSDRYDLIIVPQVEPTVICWFACLGLHQKFVMHLHGNPSLEKSHVKAKILFFLMEKLVLRHLAYVFGTSPRQLEAFSTMFESNVPRFWVPNPVRRFSDLAEKPSDGTRPITFVNVGRFSYQKGQDILINAFAKLYEQRTNVQLKLVGHGTDEPALREQVHRLGLREIVSIEYHPDNPQVALAASDVYVSTSRWEGWSLAICEALRFGLPVISTDCDFGPSDILVDRRLGMLVPLTKEEDLVCAMKHYCDNIALEREHSEYRKTSIDRYSAEIVVPLHASALRLAAE